MILELSDCGPPLRPEKRNPQARSVEFFATVRRDWHRSFVMFGLFLRSPLVTQRRLGMLHSGCRLGQAF